METIRINERVSIDLYIIDNSKPLIAIYPGGAYGVVSAREGKPVALKFNALGFNTAVITYSVAPISYPTNLNESLEVIRLLKKDFNELYILGFSAGGHLAGLTASAMKKEVSGLILAYPVVTLGLYTHKKSMKNFLGNNYSLSNRYHLSLEHQVDKDFPRTFIWTSLKDKAVNPKNSIMLYKTLQKNKVDSKLVLFKTGRHGMALADDTAVTPEVPEYKNDEVAVWPNLVVDFINNK